MPFSYTLQSMLTLKVVCNQISFGLGIFPLNSDLQSRNYVKI